MSKANTEGLALLLQASRDFALSQVAHGHRLIPFGARVMPSGEIDFIRYVDEDTQLSLDAVYDQTQATLAREALAGQIIAAAAIAAVGGDQAELGEGFDQALRVHVEAPGHSRIVLSPFRIEARGGEQPQIRIGDMQVREASGVVFAGTGRA